MTFIYCASASQCRRGYVGYHPTGQMRVRIFSKLCPIGLSCSLVPQTEVVAVDGCRYVVHVCATRFFLNTFRPAGVVLLHLLLIPGTTFLIGGARIVEQVMQRFHASASALLTYLKHHITATSSSTNTTEPHPSYVWVCPPPLLNSRDVIIDFQAIHAVESCLL